MRRVGLELGGGYRCCVVGAKWGKKLAGGNLQLARWEV